MVVDEDFSKDHQVAGFFIKRILSAETKLLVLDKQENCLDQHANKTLKASKRFTGRYPQSINCRYSETWVGKEQNCSYSQLNYRPLQTKTGLSTDDYLDAAFVIASSERPVIVYKDGNDLAQLKALADLINAKLVCLKGNANSLAASQLQLEKPLQLSGKQSCLCCRWR